MDFDDLFQPLQELVGEWGGDEFDLYRPDYSQVDNTPVLVAKGLRYRCDPMGTKFAEPPFLRTNYYDIFGNRNILLPGDLLIKSVPDGMTPPITILTKFPTKSCTGMRTDKIANIVAESGGATIYKNVYFNLMGTSFPGIPINRALEETLRIPNVLACIYNRDNVIQTRCHLIENDFTVTVDDGNGNQVPFQKRWLIELIDSGGNEMVLTMRNI